MVKMRVISLVIILIHISSFINGIEHESLLGDGFIGRSRNNRWTSRIKNGLATAGLRDPTPAPVNFHQDDMYKIMTVEADDENPEVKVTISQFYPPTMATATTTTTSNSDLESESQIGGDGTGSFEAPSGSANDVSIIKSGERDTDVIKYEEVQALLEHFINSKFDPSNNLDVITQAFRFVKLDAHLEALLHQLKTVQESQDSFQKMTTAQETKFDLLMQQMTKLATSINSESSKLRVREERLESEIETMNRRLESAVEKIISSSTVSQIMLDLSKESLQQMDRVEGVGNQVLNVLKTLKTELGDVGQASIQVIYNVQKSEETLMRALAETGNRTIYALRQEQSSSSFHSTSTHGFTVIPVPLPHASTEENGRRGNSIQDDVSSSSNKIGVGVGISEDEPGDDGMRETHGLRPHKKVLMSCLSRKRLINGQPKDCAEVQLSDYSRSGIYKIYPFEKNPSQMVEVYCDLESEGGGWTVIQRRGDNQVPRETFFRSWHEYESGFGSSLSHLWLGLKTISVLTASGEQTLRVELKDWDNLAMEANYGYFRVANSSENYRLHVADFTGSAGDSMAYHNGMAFSTKDNDNDLEKNFSCAHRYYGGWWYKNCHQSNLNGMYYEGKGRQESYATGINWYTWHGYYYSLKSTEMKIRPRHFK